MDTRSGTWWTHWGAMRVWADAVQGSIDDRPAGGVCGAGAAARRQSTGLVPGIPDCADDRLQVAAALRGRGRRRVAGPLAATAPQSGADGPGPPRALQRPEHPYPSGLLQLDCRAGRPCGLGRCLAVPAGGYRVSARPYPAALRPRRSGPQGPGRRLGVLPRPPAAAARPGAASPWSPANAHRRVLAIRIPDRRPGHAGSAGVCLGVHHVSEHLSTMCPAWTDGRECVVNNCQRNVASALLWPSLVGPPIGGGATKASKRLYGKDTAWESEQES